VIGVPVGAMHHDQRTANRVVGDVERVRPIDERSRRAGAEPDPLGARRRGGRARGPIGGARCLPGRERNDRRQQEYRGSHARHDTYPVVGTQNRARAGNRVWNKVARPNCRARSSTETVENLSKTTLYSAVTPGYMARSSELHSIGARAFLFQSFADERLDT